MTAKFEIALTIFDPKIIAGWILVGLATATSVGHGCPVAGNPSGFGCFFFVDASRNYILAIAFLKRKQTLRVVARLNFEERLSWSSTC